MATLTLSVDGAAPAAASSSLQVGLMRGQIMVVGNDFVFGNAMQFYSNCLDCVVAENVFRSFGFVNWGRNPSGIGESSPIQLSTEYLIRLASN